MLEPSHELRSSAAQSPFQIEESEDLVRAHRLGHSGSGVHHLESQCSTQEGSRDLPSARPGAQSLLTSCGSLEEVVAEARPSCLNPPSPPQELAPVQLFLLVPGPPPPTQPPLGSVHRSASRGLQARGPAGAEPDQVIRFRGQPPLALTKLSFQNRTFSHRLSLCSAVPVSLTLLPAHPPGVFSSILVSC